MCCRTASPLAALLLLLLIIIILLRLLLLLPLLLLVVVVMDALAVVAFPVVVGCFLAVAVPMSGPREDSTGGPRRPSRSWPSCAASHSRPVSWPHLGPAWPRVVSLAVVLSRFCSSGTCSLVFAVLASRFCFSLRFALAVFWHLPWLSRFCFSGT